MHITLETDYAVRIVSVLCVDGGRLDAKTISERSEVSQRFALKILRKLVVAGIVKSYKGTQGGYIVAVSPEEITLKTVVEAIEGTYYFSRCLAVDGVCSRGAKEVCCYREAFSEISQLVRDKLESYNFADMIKNSKEFNGQLKSEKIGENAVEKQEKQL